MEQEPNQVLEKLTSIEKQIESLRITFGAGIIILALVLTFLVPTLIKLFTADSGPSYAPTVTPAAHQEETPAAATSTATSTPR